MILCSMLSGKALGQSVAELSYNLIHEKCAEYSAAEMSRSCVKKADSELNDLKKNMSEVSEATLLGSLALEKNESLTCADTQLSFLQGHHKEAEAFVDDYTHKLILLGHEKRFLNELRKKNNKSKEELEEYDRALKRSEALLRSLRFAELGPFKDVIQYVAQQYDQYTPDRLQEWLPAQVKKLLKKAITQSIEEVNRDRVIYLKGSLSMGASLSTAQRESLAQDQELVESFLKKSQTSGADTLATWCRVNAKYGDGARYRDNALLGVSLLSLPATGLLRVGAAFGQVSVRSANILKVAAGAAGGTLAVTQLYKSCIDERTELGSEKTSPSEESASCDGNILKSQIQENCSLIASLSALSIPLSAKGVKDAFAALTRNETNRAAAIKKAHEIGRGQVGEDGTAAKVGNYTFQQKLKKARTLKDASIAKEERRKLFESGKVGDGDYIDELIKIEDEIAQFEKNVWKSQGANKGTTDDLIALRAKLDEAMDAPADEMAQRISKLREELGLLGKAKPGAAPATSSNVGTLNDIIENPQSLRTGKPIPLNNDAKNPIIIKFEADAIDDLAKADKVVVNKFVHSLQMSTAGNNAIDPTRIKYLNELEHGSKGKAFEVRVPSQTGHQRLLGCFQGGIFTILKYNPHAPSDKKGYQHLYKDMCR